MCSRRHRDGGRPSSGAGSEIFTNQPFTRMCGCGDELALAGGSHDFSSIASPVATVVVATSLRLSPQKRGIEARQIASTDGRARLRGHQVGDYPDETWVPRGAAQIADDERTRVKGEFPALDAITAEVRCDDLTSLRTRSQPRRSPETTSSARNSSGSLPSSLP